MTIIICIVIYYSSMWSNKAKKGKSNIINAKLIKFQMKNSVVISLMGRPDTIISNRFCYMTNDDSYPYIEFSFDSLGRVKEIYSPNK